MELYRTFLEITLNNGWRILILTTTKGAEVYVAFLLTYLSAEAFSFLLRQHLHHQIWLPLIFEYHITLI